MIKNRHFILIAVSLFYSLFFLVQCQKRRSQGLRIILEQAPQSKHTDTDDFSSNSVSTTPSALSQINCIGVLVGYTKDPNAGNCTTSNTTFGVSRFGGLTRFVSGTPTNISVGGLKGEREVNIRIIGFNSSSGTCAVVNSSFDPENSGYSDPYILASSNTTLASGDTTTISLSPTFNVTEKIASCDSSIFRKTNDLISNIVAYWNFDSLLGANYADSSGNGRTLGNTEYSLGNLTASQGFIGSALIGNGMAPSGSSYAVYSSYNGSVDRYWQMGSSTKSQKSFAFWVKADASVTPNSYGHVINNVSSAAAAGYAIAMKATGSTTIIPALVLKQSGSTSNYDSDPSDCSTTNGAGWTHYVATVDFTTSTAKFYKNGTLCGSGVSFTETDVSNILHAHVGFNSGSSPHVGLEALVDSIGIWDKILTATQINVLYSKNLGGNDLF